uniref:hypothetical protein n=1 Tax=Pseudomonas sp. 100_A TaxID=2813571 RepID=UPI001A9F8F6E
EMSGSVVSMMHLVQTVTLSVPLEHIAGFSWRLALIKANPVVGEILIFGLPAADRTDRTQVLRGSVSTEDR